MKNEFRKTQPNTFVYSNRVPIPKNLLVSKFGYRGSYWWLVRWHFNHIYWWLTMNLLYRCLAVNLIWQHFWFASQTCRCHRSLFRCLLNSSLNFLNHRVLTQRPDTSSTRPSLVEYIVRAPKLKCFSLHKRRCSFHNQRWRLSKLVDYLLRIWRWAHKFLLLIFFIGFCPWWEQILSTKSVFSFHYNFKNEL